MEWVLQRVEGRLCGCCGASVRTLWPFCADSLGTVTNYTGCKTCVQT